MRAGILVAAAALAIAALGLVGYAVGKAAAPNTGDARQALAGARHGAGSAAERTAAARGKRRGYRAGQASGERSGRQAGSARGAAAGQRVRDAQVAQAAEAQRAEDQRAAEAEQQERAENCGAPLFPDDVCPTDEEIEQENKAESLCGGGDHEQAKAEGIACFPPGDPRNP